MYSDVSLSPKEKRAKDYEEGFGRLRQVLKALTGIQELIATGERNTRELSTAGRDGLAAILEALTRDGWDGLGKIFFPYEVRSLLDLDGHWEPSHEGQEEDMPPLS